MRLARLRNWLARGVSADHEHLLAEAALLCLAETEAGTGAALGAGTRGAAEPPRQPPTLSAPPPAAWPAVRIDVVEELWGEGFLSPGGAEDVLRLAAPLGLSDSNSVLLLGADMGGGVRVLAEAFACWVSGFEADPTLAALAATRLKRIGGEVARRGSVAVFNPFKPVFKKRGYNHAIALDAIRAGAPEDMLGAVAMALRPGGQLVLVQTVVKTRIDPGNPAIAAWARLEQRDPVIPVGAEITRVLGRLGFDVRVVEDASDRHIQLVLQGWARLVRSLEGPKPAPLHAAAIVREAERWMRRVRLMQAGQLRLLRWHAISRDGTPPLV